jgi:Kdo2-lipid IVA lauroyltransferase/acyltransferase
MKIFKYLIEALLIYTFFIIIKVLRINFSRKLFSYIFNKIGPLIKSKEVIEENLERILGSLDRDNKHKIISKMWSNYSSTFVEYLFLNNFKRNSQHITIKGEKILNKIIQANKPVIFISGHFANFELMSMELTKRKIKLATIYRPLNNFFLNPFMEYVRRKYICRNQIKKGIAGIRDAVEYIKDNHCVALMVDQRVSEGKKLSFFNKNALTTTLPAQLALRYKCDIVPIYIFRKPNDYFEMEVFEPINVLSKSETEIDKLEISLKINKLIEQMVLKDPSQWILTHNRWK